MPLYRDILLCLLFRPCLFELGQCKSFTLLIKLFSLKLRFLFSRVFVLMKILSDKNIFIFNFTHWWKFSTYIWEFRCILFMFYRRKFKVIYIVLKLKQILLSNLLFLFLYLDEFNHSIYVSFSFFNLVSQLFLHAPLLHRLFF